MADTKFLKMLEDECDSELCKLGFTRLRRGGVVWEFDSNFLGWIGLNTGNHGNTVRLNPFVGIHVVDIMKLSAAFSNKKYVKGGTATYAIHLGELVPKIPTFEFEVGADLNPEAKRLALAIYEHGLKYMASLRNYEALGPFLYERMPLHGGYPERYILSLYCAGKIDQADKLASAIVEGESAWSEYSTPSITEFCRAYLEHR
ncbi:hypothetical protein RF679_03250 [Undibacterium cyanobacteriorum]|uniref:Uncharacterized protein n=1 Tax=Undibacterium cyanobacteriorum TaxID=3073561 RepID=A0ABY9RJA1_9BURK|nr:hypothetical protein [Undibacterium sp. 20NA77.5]WMW81307.1 hypothetical protein RF679_03250 [Undibacterium sp. 20NA77.5]